MEHRLLSRARYLGLLAALGLLTHCGDNTDREDPGGGPPRLQEASVATTLATTHTFMPIADARVEESTPSRNFGFASVLGADLSPREETYLRFSLSGLKGAVTRATLRLYASDGTSAGPQVFSVSQRWPEEGLTWSNRPARNSVPVASTGAIARGAWVEYDVTGAVRGNGLHGFALVATSSDGVDFASRESVQSELRPRLIVTVTSEPPAPTGCMFRTDTYLRSFNALADGYVSQSEPARNFSSELQLRADGSPVLESYLRFEVETEGMAVRSARLELDVTDPTSNGPWLYRARSDWSEEGLTWNTRPSLLGEGSVGNLGALSAGTRVSYDLTGVVSDEGAYGFALLPESSDGVVFASSEVAPWNNRGPYLFYSLESPTYCSYRGTGGGLTEWVRQYGGAGAEHLDALASHPEGGFVAVGRFGEASFPAEEGLALARYSATGAPLWSRVVTTANVRPTRVTVTPQGHILVAGSYRGSPDLGTGPLPYVLENTWGGLFLARFSPSGQSLWVRGFSAYDEQGDVTGSFASAIGSDGSGNLLVTGGFQGWLNLGGGALVSSTSSSESRRWGGFVAKFGSEGQYLWSRAFQNGEQSPYEVAPQGYGVSADAAGNVLVGGTASVGTDLGDGSASQRGPFIAKYSPAGALLWKRLFSGAYGYVSDVKPQGANRIGFIGNFGGAFTFAGRSYFGGNPNDGYQLPPNTNGFLGTVTDAGADVWLNSIGTGTGFILSFRTVAIGEDGAFTVSGTGQETFDLGGGPMGFSLGFIPYWSTRRSFVARYSASGQHLWSRAFDLERTVHPALQPGGAVVLGLSLDRDFELEGSTYTASGMSDLLYLRVVR